MPKPGMPWIHTLPSPPPRLLPTGEWAVGGDVLLTVSEDTPAGIYPLTIEAEGPPDGEPDLTRAELVVRVLQPR